MADVVGVAAEVGDASRASAVDHELHRPARAQRARAPSSVYAHLRASLQQAARSPA